MKQEIRDVHEALEGLGYIAGREIATAVYLSWQMKKPLLFPTRKPESGCTN